MSNRCFRCSFLFVWGKKEAKNIYTYSPALKDYIICNKQFSIVINLQSLVVTIINLQLSNQATTKNSDSPRPFNTSAILPIPNWQLSMPRFHIKKNRENNRCLSNLNTKQHSTSLPQCQTVNLIICFNFVMAVGFPCLAKKIEPVFFPLPNGACHLLLDGDGIHKLTTRLLFADCGR